MARALSEPTGEPGPEHAPVPLPVAYRECEALARSHYENFPIASRFLTADRRRALAAIYAFARRADDLADADATSEERLQALDRIEAALLRALDGSPGGPVLTALADTIERHRLPTEPFLDLLAAFRQDARNATFETWDDLLAYCRGSATTIGRLVLKLHAIEEPDTLVASDHVTTALQLTNFWQDLGRDLARGRVFLPREDLARFGLDRESFAEAAHRESLTRLLVAECRATEELYDLGSGVVRSVPFGLAVQLRATLAGGRAILREVERRGAGVLANRPSLGRAAKAGLALRAVLGFDA